MKKTVYIGILAITAVAAFIIGIIVSNAFSGKYSKNDVVGVYETDSWNGNTGTLVLYKDGTCQYPSGGKAKWTLDNDTVLISVEKTSTIADGSVDCIHVLISGTASNDRIDIGPPSNDEIDAIVSSIAALDNVKEAFSPQKDSQILKVYLATPETNNKTCDEIRKIPGVAILSIGSEVVTTSDHEAKIMEDGLILDETFFEKVSD